MEVLLTRRHRICCPTCTPLLMPPPPRADSRLDPSKVQLEGNLRSLAQILLRDEHGLNYSRAQYCNRKRTVEQSYRIFHKGRIPLYLEHFIGAGEDVKQFTEKHNIPWDTSDYIPLTEWRPCPAHAESPEEYDLFVVNQKVPFLTLTITSENAWLVELAHRSGKVFTVGMNAATGRGKGIAEGDEMELETPSGKKFRGVARLTEESIRNVRSRHSGRWITANDNARGQGSTLTAFSNMPSTASTLSSALMPA
jgi:anaerobic selenocysteine-containing dehydrogenase